MTHVVHEFSQTDQNYFCDKFPSSQPELFEFVKFEVSCTRPTARSVPRGLLEFIVEASKTLSLLNYEVGTSYYLEVLTLGIPS